MIKYQNSINSTKYQNATSFTDVLFDYASYEI